MHYQKAYNKTQKVKRKQGKISRKLFSEQRYTKQQTKTEETEGSKLQHTHRISMNPNLNKRFTIKRKKYTQSQIN